MEILSGFISTFLSCYLIYWIVSLFKSSKGAKIAFVLITLDVLSMLIYPIIELVFVIQNYNNYEGNSAVYYIIYVVATIISTIAAYALFVYLFYGSNIHFKSARLRQFERQYNGKSNILNIFFKILLSLFAIASISMGVYLIVNKTVSKGIVGAIGLFIFAAVIIGFIGKSFIGEKKITKHTKKESSNDFYFLISTNTNKYLYQSKGDKSFKDSLNGFDDYFVIDELGIIKGPDFKKNIYFINVSYFDTNYLNKLDMEYVDNNKIVDIILNIDKLHQKVVTVDDLFNVINIKDR